jgi:hypothetical protein
MKRYIFILIAVLLTCVVNAQVKQEVIASAGGYNSNGGLSISWTLGETIIPTFKSADNSLILTHGFQQQVIVTTIEEKIDVFVIVKVYPNPVSDLVNIQFDSPLESEIVMTILDSQGRLVKKDVIETNSVEKQINMQEFPAGIYYLRLIKGIQTNVYKVVKL